MRAHSIVYIAIGLSACGGALAACDLAVVGTQPALLLDAAVADTYAPPKADTGVPVDAGKPDSGSPGGDAGVVTDTGIDTGVADTGADAGSTCDRLGGKVFNNRCYWFTATKVVFANAQTECTRVPNGKFVEGLDFEPLNTLSTPPPAINYSIICPAAGSIGCWVKNSTFPGNQVKNCVADDGGACIINSLGNREFVEARKPQTESKSAFCEFPSP